MSHGWRKLGAGLACLQALMLAGCWSTQTAALPTTGESLAADLTIEESPRLARMQRGDVAQSQAPKIGAPTPFSTIGTSSSTSGARPVSLSAPKGKSMSVRAWVNGRPIFDDEVMNAIPPAAMRPLSNMSESQRIEKLTEIYNQVLDQIIEQEVVYQEAVRKLEKANPKTLEKLKQLAEQDFEKQLSKIAAKMPPHELKELQRSMRRQMERSFIAMEYMRSRIFPGIQRIGYQEIKDYYDEHLNEFTKVETVKWQNVFIAAGSTRCPTLAQAKRFAEDLIATCRTSDDFAKLVQYDDGDAKFRNGEGLGSRRGEIKPAEVEDSLFKLREGEIGPVVELSTGVHLVRLVSRDSGGLQPLNDQVQSQIKSKLRSQMADREYKRVIRELRSRAVVDVERGE
jgi:parvulin-like peptidyl-prolyl isomerase